MGSGTAVTLLYGLGMTLTLLRVTGLLSYAGLAAVLLTVMTGVLSAASLDHRAAWVIGSVTAAGCVIWLLMGGLTELLDVMQALLLHMSGLHAALPLVAREAAVLGTLLCGAASFFVTQRSAGPYPALVVLLLTVVLLWLGNRAQVLWYLLPTVVASVTLLLQGSHDISAFRVLPLAAVTVLLSFSGVALGGATVPPLKEAADNLRQRIYDIFLFTGSRDVFSLADVGYYPQGENQLGGPAEPTKEPVMVVITPRKVYLRGSIRNVYTGRRWEDGTEGKRYLWEGVGFRSIRSTVFDMALPQVSDLSYSALLEPDTVIVRMLGHSASSMFAPQRVRELNAQGALVPYFNAGSEIFATRDLEIEDTWTVTAPLLVAGDRGLPSLLSGCETLDDPNWESVCAQYLALPEHLEQEIYDIATQAVAGAETPYEMALALEQHLRTGYAYTLEAEEQSPHMDFVSTFLLLDKKGYCTHFASAMTVLCRMVGLPARYVEGFVATPETEGERAGMAVVTGEQGHAWTEVYFSGFGWLTFDATPAGSEVIYAAPDQMAQDESDVPEPTSTPEPPAATDTAVPTETPSPALTDSPTPSPSPVPEAATPTPAPSELPQDAGGNTGQKRGFPWWIVAVAAAALAVLLPVGRVLWMTPLWQSKRQKNEFGRWLVWAQAAHDALRQLGMTRQPTETPMAFLARVDAERVVPLVLSQLSGAESLMFYGHAVPLPEETKQAQLAYEVVKAKLRPGMRVRMALERAFLPRRRWDITRI